MKKSNVLILAILAVAAAFFLWLWYYLKFDLVDNPLDLVLAIVWWAVVGIACLGIHQLEKKRRERVRTCYVVGSQLFNSERGLANMEGDAVEAIQRVLQDLQYDFGAKESPFGGEQGTKCDFAIRSSKFAAAGEPDERGLKPLNEWEGEVVYTANPSEPKVFSGKDELAKILAA